MAPNANIAEPTMAEKVDQVNERIDKLESMHRSMETRLQEQIGQVLKAIQNNNNAVNPVYAGTNPAENRFPGDEGINSSTNKANPIKNENDFAANSSDLGQVKGQFIKAAAEPPLERQFPGLHQEGYHHQFNPSSTPFDGSSHVNPSRTPFDGSSHAEHHYESYGSGNADFLALGGSLKFPTSENHMLIALKAMVPTLFFAPHYKGQNRLASMKPLKIEEHLNLDIATIETVFSISKKLVAIKNTVTAHNVAIIDIYDHFRNYLSLHHVATLDAYIEGSKKPFVKSVNGLDGYYKLLIFLFYNLDLNDIQQQQELAILDQTPDIGSDLKDYLTQLTQKSYNLPNIQFRTILLRINQLWRINSPATYANAAVHLKLDDMDQLTVFDLMARFLPRGIKIERLSNAALQSATPSAVFNYHNKNQQSYRQHIIRSNNSSAGAKPFKPFDKCPNLKKTTKFFKPGCNCQLCLHNQDKYYKFTKKTGGPNRGFNSITEYISSSPGYPSTGIDSNGTPIPSMEALHNSIPVMEPSDDDSGLSSEDYDDEVPDESTSPLRP
ncbi:hypothetical protein WICMUC_000497 [Wickerhamomyces mucosus]|uniref:Uncharacterized protein n=1 Tax=Wickerhamomyces mucosus TaxID=1378264 RepID=A0A9P8PZ45_9ASCO|nr:hypothetical protein WICMUC_000497 [Wickerhamomyces mucosus]